jgi:site-specific DNA-cytosine methylase
VEIRISRAGSRFALEWQDTDRPAPTIAATAIRHEREFGWIEVDLEPGDLMRDVRRRAPKRGTKPPPGGKPPYQTPTLAQVRSARSNGLVCISTFAGAGGSSIGYRLAGYRVAAAVDVNPLAVESYRLNFPETVVLERDIRKLSGRELLRAAGVRKGELDLFDGSPPCTPFSSAGRRQKTWGQERAHAGTRQVVDDLFLEYARLLGEMQPRAFAAENVTGLAKGVSVGYFRAIRAALEQQGYHVEVRTLDAQWMGVPQARQRVIFAGVRHDVWQKAKLAQIPWPKPLGYRYSVREALPWLDPDAAIVAKRGTPWGDPERVAAGNGTPTEVQLDDGDPAKTVTEPSKLEVRVVHDNGRPNEPAQEILERPAMTIAAVSEGHDQIELRVIHDKQRPQRPARDIIDGPSPTIVAGEAEKYSGPFSDVEVRVMHDTQGGDHAGPPKDVLDTPAPAVTGGSRGWNAEHFQVEQRVHHDGHGGWYGAQGEVTDEPFPAIPAQAPSIGSVEMIVGNDAFEPRFGPLDEPTPTLTASGARTSGELQTRVEHDTRGRFATPGEITDRPSPTITLAGIEGGGGAGQHFKVVREDEHGVTLKRKFTILEVKRLFGFPDDYELAGKYHEQWAQLGNSVCPPMSRGVGKALAPLLRKTKKGGPKAAPMRTS